MNKTNETTRNRNSTRNGKIARLPLALREELNRRLREGEGGRTLLAWLNASPAVRAVLEAEELRERRLGNFAANYAKKSAIRLPEGN
jgi:hypothetical protein